MLFIEIIQFGWRILSKTTDEFYSKNVKFPNQILNLNDCIQSYFFAYKNGARKDDF